MQAFFERRSRPDDDVRGKTRPSQRLVGEPAPSPFWLCVVGNDDQEVIVAVPSGIATGFRAEEVNTLGLEGLHQASQQRLRATAFGRSPALLVLLARQRGPDR